MTWENIESLSSTVFGAKIFRLTTRPPVPVCSIMQSSSLEGFCWLNPTEDEEPAFQQVLAKAGWGVPDEDE